MPPPRRDLGRTGLCVSDICFGTAALGGFPETDGFEVGAAAARRAVRAIFSQRRRHP